jgi:hypothetical protein
MSDLHLFVYALAVGWLIQRVYWLIKDNLWLRRQLKASASPAMCFPKEWLLDIYKGR